MGGRWRRNSGGWRLAPEWKIRERKYGGCGGLVDNGENPALYSFFFKILKTIFKPNAQSNEAPSSSSSMSPMPGIPKAKYQFRTGNVSIFQIN